MCFPSSSSLIEEYYKVNELPDFLKNEPFKDLNNSDKIDAVKDAIKNGLEILKVTGGEPFASREFIEIVKWSIANNYASNLRLFITTNGTKFSKTLLDKLVNFKEVKFTISVEGTEDVYTYIRHRSSWKQLNQNIQNLTNYKSKFNNISIRVSCVLTAYNLFDIKNLAFWCNVNELNLHVDFNLKPYDSELSVRHLPSKLIAEAVFEIKPFNFSGVDALISFLSDHCSYNEERCKTLLATTQLFDKQRNESYTVLDNRLVDFLNNV
jgi:MoaA/NifB/PqqE/SkfB family radical SAM enzyme